MLEDIAVFINNKVDVSTNIIEILKNILTIKEIKNKKVKYEKAMCNGATEIEKKIYYKLFFNS